MIGTWTPNTNYFTIIELDDLQEILDEMLVAIVRYDPKIEWRLGDVCRNVKYLADNKVAINIQISNPAYTNEEAVLDYINEQDFDLAKYYLQKEKFLTQEEKFLTQEEYKNLEPLIIKEY